MTNPIQPLRLQRPITDLTPFLTPQTQHPDFQKPLRLIHSDHLSQHVHLACLYDLLPPNMNGLTNRATIVTTCLLGPCHCLSLLLCFSAPNNFSHHLLLPDLLQPRLFCLLCQPLLFFPLQPLLLPQVSLLLLLKPNTFGFSLGLVSLNFDEGWHNGVRFIRSGSSIWEMVGLRDKERI